MVVVGAGVGFNVGRGEVGRDGVVGDAGGCGVGMGAGAGCVVAVVVDAALWLFLKSSKVSVMVRFCFLAWLSVTKKTSHLQQ